MIEFLEGILDGGGGEEEEELAGEDIDRLPGEGGGITEVMGFVHDEEVPGNLPRDGEVVGLFQGVKGGDDAVGLAPECIGIGVGVVVGGGDGEVEFLGQFLRPLVHQGRLGEDEEATDHASGDVFAKDETGFDGFAEADLIGEQGAAAEGAEDTEGGADLVFEVLDAAEREAEKVVGLIGDPPLQGAFAEEPVVQVGEGDEIGLELEAQRFQFGGDFDRGRWG